MVILVVSLLRLQALLEIKPLFLLYFLIDPAFRGPVELTIGDAKVLLSMKMEHEAMILCVKNQCDDKLLKCSVDTFVMAHKVGKKLINTRKNLEITGLGESQWKVQDGRFFILNCLSKRDMKNEAVIRFKAQILVEIKQVYVDFKKDLPKEATDSN